jgi:hypothetical protein
MFDMATDASLFHVDEDLRADGWHLAGNIFVSGIKRMIPLYEAKMLHHFDSRFATYENATQAQVNKGTLPRFTASQHADLSCMPLPRYWVDEAEVENRLDGHGWTEGWLLAWRRTGRSTDERTMINSIMPRSAAGDSIFLMLASMPTRMCALLAVSLSSFVLDFVARQKTAGANLSYFIVQQFPVPAPEVYRQSDALYGGVDLASWMLPRIVELMYTATDTGAFARELGDHGLPFRWDEGRRFRIRAELDAAFFLVYGIERHDVISIMDSFRAFQNNDRPRFERTKELILEIYDAMTEAALVGQPYQTIVDPPPGQGPRHG